jgi:hypothetical protein
VEWVLLLGVAGFGWWYWKQLRSRRAVNQAAERLATVTCRSSDDVAREILDRNLTPGEWAAAQGLDPVSFAPRDHGPRLAAQQRPQTQLGGVEEQAFRDVAWPFIASTFKVQDRKSLAEAASPITGDLSFDGALINHSFGMFESRLREQGFDPHPLQVWRDQAHLRFLQRLTAEYPELGYEERHLISIVLRSRAYLELSQGKLAHFDRIRDASHDDRRAREMRWSLKELAHVAAQVDVAELAGSVEQTRGVRDLLDERMRELQDLLEQFRSDLQPIAPDLYDGPLE